MFGPVAFWAIRSTAFLAVMVVTIVAACTGTGSSSDWAGSVTDSAGVAVVQNPPDGTWAPATGWAVEEVLAVGGPGSGPDAQFGKITGIDVDDQGNIYAADVIAQSVNVFDPAGSYLRTIGAPGAGPGEFGGTIAGVS